MKYGIIFTQQPVDRGEIINPDWMILDSFLTVSLVRNQDILHSVNTCTPEDKLCVYTNGGYLDYDWMGKLKYLPFDIFYNPWTIANIPSLE